MWTSPPFYKWSKQGLEIFSKLLEITGADSMLTSQSAVQRVLSSPTRPFFSPPKSLLVPGAGWKCCGINAPRNSLWASGGYELKVRYPSFLVAGVRSNEREQLWDTWPALCLSVPGRSEPQLSSVACLVMHHFSCLPLPVLIPCPMTSPSWERLPNKWLAPGSLSEGLRLVEPNGRQPQH